MAVDLEELLKAVEDKIKQKEEEKGIKKPSSESTKRFIETMNIRRGLDRVPNYVIFFTYMKKYKAEAGEEKWSKVHFFRVFNRYFDQARVGKQRYYVLDGSSFDLTREGRIEAKAYDEAYQREVGIKTGKIKPRKRRKAFKNKKG